MAGVPPHFQRLFSPAATGLALLVYGSRNYGALYSAEWELAEYGRIDPTHSQTPSLRRLPSPEPSRSDYVAGSRLGGLEAESHAVRVGWQAGHATATGTAAALSSGRLWRDNDLSSAPAPGSFADWRSSGQVPH